MSKGQQVNTGTKPKTTYKADVVDTSEQLSVLVPEAVWDKMKAWVDLANGEVSGMGEVERSEDGKTYTVKDIWLAKQECSAGSTNLDGSAVAELRERLYTQGKALGGLKLWWHSHANMAVFWSGVDEATKAMLVKDSSWVLSMVVNKKRDVKACLDEVLHDGVLKLSHDDLAVYVDCPENANTAQYKAEFDACVSDLRSATKPDITDQGWFTAHDRRHSYRRGDWYSEAGYSGPYGDEYPTYPEQELGSTPPLTKVTPISPLGQEDSEKLQKELKPAEKEYLRRVLGKAYKNAFLLRTTCPISKKVEVCVWVPKHNCLLGMDAITALFDTYGNKVAVDSDLLDTRLRVVAGRVRFNAKQIKDGGGV